MYVDALSGEEPQPLPSFATLPMGYFLSRNYDRLANFWGILAKQTDLNNLPPELSFWRKCSELLRVVLQEARPYNAYLQTLATYCRTLPEPTDESAKFYLAVAKVGMDTFGLSGESRAAIQSVAVTPWLR